MILTTSCIPYKEYLADHRLIYHQTAKSYLFAVF